MKKSLLALAVLGAFAGTASAQSSVTLFGIVDLSVNAFKNGSVSSKTMNSNQLNSNRLGFRGVEDLGGGMSASFWLEGGMDNDTGSPGGFNFQRRSTVSLAGSFGEVRLGRDYTNTFSVRASGDAYGANGFGNTSSLYASTVANMGSGITTAVRANNMVGYFLPGNLGGLYGSVQVAAGEGVVGNKYVGVRLGYAAGPFDIQAATSSTQGAGDVKYKVMNLAGSYNLGVAKVYLLLDQSKFGARKYRTTQISASMPMGQSEFRVSFAKGDASGGTAAQAGQDATLMGAEYIYNLSKRTAVYGQLGRLNNKGTSNISLGGIATAATGFKSTGYGVGVRHSF